MRTFQITQNWGKGTLGFIYFDVEDSSTEKEIEAKAIFEQKKDYKDRYSGFGGKVPERPTIVVKEYCNKTHKILKGGFRFKTKWR